MEECEETEEYQAIDADRQGVLLIDCCEGAFEPESSSFKIAITAAYNYYDGEIMFHKGSNASLKVLLCHPDTAMQVIVSSSMSAIAAYKLLYGLTKMSVEDLKGQYCCPANGTLVPFSEHFGNALKMIQNVQSGIIFYATVTEDPVLDNQDRSILFRHCEALRLLKGRFEPLPLRDTICFETLFDEMASLVTYPLHHYYYNAETITEKITDLIHFKDRTMAMQVYPLMTSSRAFPIIRKIVTKEYYSYGDTPVHKTTMEVLQQYTTSVGSDNYYVPFSPTNADLTESEFKSVQDLKLVNAGITFLEARMFWQTPYFVNVQSRRAILIGAHPQHEKEFDNWWNTFHGMRLLTLIRFRMSASPYNAELVPVELSGVRHFVARFIPSVEEFDPSIDDADELNFNDHMGRQLEQLVWAMMIPDFGALLKNMCPPNTAEQAEYAKENILPDYKAAAIKYYQEATWYHTGEDAIKEIAKTLQALTHISKKRKRN